MHFNAQSVRFGEEKGERIPAGIFAERTGEILRPGLVAGTLVGVTTGANLKEHGVKPGGLYPAQQGAEGCLLLNKVRCVRPVKSGRGGYPHCPDFGFWRGDGKRRL